VDEDALVKELQRKRIWAYLDVTNPEPPAPDSPLYQCPNLTLTPHVAGSQARGRLRLGQRSYLELKAFFAGEMLTYPVTREMLDRIA
jgi:phosphoglycerate dehydrogenase-like enzyme